MRIIFTIIGFLFILTFTVRGIYQIVFTFVNHFNDVSALLSGNKTGQSEHWTVIIGALKQSPGGLFDTILLILCGLITIHGVIGIYYAISTNYKILKMLKEKKWFYLQIISAVAVAFVIMALMMPAGEATAHAVAFWILAILAAILGAFHIAKGFFNACITLGISVSQQTKFLVKILSWIIAVISAMQIIILFI